MAAGGIGNGGEFLASAEVWDPATGDWTATGNLTAARRDFQMMLLPNGTGEGQGVLCWYISTT